MIKRSTLPKGVITKLLDDIKLVRTLQVNPKMQKSCHDARLEIAQV
jgi:hypothetical protein